VPTVKRKDRGTTLGGANEFVGVLHGQATRNERALMQPGSIAEAGVWRYPEFLPEVASESRVSLAEGGTPLLVAPALAKQLGVNLLIKDETRNPTGSFKDRIIAVAASVALEKGARGMVCASTGNAGASTAAYAARAGIPGLVLAPAGAPSAKVAVAQAYGAQWISVDGNYSDAYALAIAAASELKFMNVTTTFVCPYSVEGSKTVGLEILDQMGGDVPDWIVVPIGAGPLLVGIQRAYSLLLEYGRIPRLPRMLAVQPAGCAPIARAQRENQNSVQAWGIPDTVVSGLADPLNGYEGEGDITLASIRLSQGAAVIVDDQNTIAWVRRLAAGAGVFAEPSGAIALAAVEQARAEGIIVAGETVVCCVTGSGLKDLRSLGRLEAPTVIAPSIEQLSSVLADAGI
jgi:threonine synthase